MPRGVYERSGFCKHANCRGGDISRLFWERVTRKGPWLTMVWEDAGIGWAVCMPTGMDNSEGNGPIE